MNHRQENMNQDRAGEATLESWKEIAAYVQREVRTVRRWEKEEGLPIHRHVHKSRGSVYAYRSEIDAWRTGRRGVAEIVPARPRWRALAVGATTLLCVMMVGNGIQPAVASAQTPEARQIWAKALGGGEDSISVDGRYMVYADWESGNLAVRDLVLGSNRPLTNTGGWVPPAQGWAEASAISPDNF